MNSKNIQILILLHKFLTNLNGENPNGYKTKATKTNYEYSFALAIFVVT